MARPFYNVLYTLALALAFPFMLPGFLLRMCRRGGYAARMGDRFAIYPADIVARFRDGSSRKRPVWIHAVSVGEVQVAAQLMREWRAVEPDIVFCFSTTSSTGWKIASSLIGENDTLIYNPLDFPNFVKSAFRLVRPRAVVLTESEIWPEFINRAKKYSIPLFLINARMSDRSAPRYARARFFFKKVFSSFDAIFSQSELDTKRLVAAGAPAERIETTGSFKFDVAKRNTSKEAEMREWIGDGAGRILLGASTWPGEDAVLLEILKTLPDDVTLVIAPRHFEKADAVEANIRKAGCECVRRSRGEKGGGKCSSPRVFLADTTGELMGLFGIADAVFVGKSLCEHGSQNMIEPCLCGKCVVVGPYTENFRPVMSDLLSAGAIVQVKDKGELGDVIRRWFSPEGAQEAAKLGERAEKAVASRRGVVPKCVRAIISKCAQAHPCFGDAAHGDGVAAVPRRSRLATVVSAACVAAVVAAVAVLCSVRHEAETAIPDGSMFRYHPLDTISAYAALVECPDAATAYFADATAAARYAPILSRAGLACATNATPGDFTYDIILSSDASFRKWNRLKRHLSENGIIAVAADVRKLTLAGMEELVDSLGGRDIHLWMSGENDWVFVMRSSTNTTDFAAMLDVFARDGAFEDLAAARCNSLSDIFACYAGDYDSFSGAFTGNMQAEVKSEYFVTREVPDIEWISAEDTDEDIVAPVARAIRSMQVIRRNVIEGNMLAREEGKFEDAISKWASAALANPNDSMLLDRLHRLAVNAATFLRVGNVKAAAKCYETMVSIRPTDYEALREYSKCLLQLGERDLASKARHRADELERLKLEELK